MFSYEQCVWIIVIKRSRHVRSRISGYPVLVLAKYSVSDIWPNHYLNMLASKDLSVDDKPMHY